MNAIPIKTKLMIRLREVRIIYNFCSNFSYFFTFSLIIADSTSSLFSSYCSVSIFPKTNIRVTAVPMKQKTYGKFVIIDKRAIMDVESKRGILFLVLLTRQNSAMVKFFKR